MRKAFNSENNEILKIKPIDELETTQPAEFKEEPKAEKIIKFAHQEVFINNSNLEEKKEDEDLLVPDLENTEEDTEYIEDPEPEQEIKKVKKKRGQRGKDKKPRIRKPPSEKVLAHLAKAREKSKLARQAKKLEKERLKKEAEEKAIKNTAKNRKVNINNNPINPNNIFNTNNYEQFFNLMDKYEAYKEKKKQVKQIKPQPQAHPANRVFEKPARPKEILNPFDVCFQYGNNRKNFYP